LRSAATTSPVSTFPIDSDINYGGNFPYDVILRIGTNGEYGHGRVLYTF
jgi:hypothetical protein